LTGFRLWIRAGRFWWEDWLALIAACSAVVTFVTMWIVHLSLDSPGWLYVWLDIISYCMVVWLSRISILCSVLRVATNTSIRQILNGSLMLFVVMWIIALTTKLWFCGKDTSWETFEPSVCPMPMSMSVIEAVTDVVSALILIAVPISMLWDLKLARKRKILLYIIFSMGFLSAAASLVHIVFLVPSTALSNITALIQTSTDIALCNLLVTVTFIYHQTLSEGTSADADTDDATLSYESRSQTRTQTPSRLTTVELEYRNSLSSNDGTGATRGTDGEYSPSLTSRQQPPLSERTPSKRGAGTYI